MLLSDIAVLISGVLLIFAGVGLLIGLYFSCFRFSSRGFALPVLFMNAGNMGIPLAPFDFGQDGMQRYLNVRDHHVSSIFAGDLALEQARRLAPRFFVYR